jgi:hypothetical protein
MAHFYGSEGERLVLWNNTSELHVSVRLFTFNLFYKHQYLSQLRNSPTSVTPEDPPPCSQEFDNGVYRETDESSSDRHSYLFKIHIDGPIILQPTHLLARWFFFFGYSNFCTNFSSLSFLMQSSLSHPPRFDHANNIW